jgi:photosystem II stability/assembly factor-like uncharacterized protein
MRPTKALAGLAATTAVILGMAACTNATTAPPTADASLEHVHAFAHVDNSPVVLVGTHTGLWKFALTAVDPDRPREAPLIPVGDDRFDVMGLTTTPQDVLIASGHPAVTAPTTAPSNRGLLRSEDSGTTWQTISLEGKADFHDLTTAADSVLGLNSTTQAILRSGDDGATWTTEATTTALSLAVDSANPEILWAAGPDGLERSTDRGATLTPSPEAPPLVHVASSAYSIAGATIDGTVWSLDPGSATWSQVGQLEGQPQAFDIIDIGDKTVQFAVDDRAIVVSHDNGRTWTPVPLTLKQNE